MSRKAPLPPRMRMAVNALLGMGLLQVLKILSTNDCVPYLYIIAVTQCLTAWKIQVHLLIEFLVDFDHVPLDICNYAACCSVSGVQCISLKHHPVNTLYMSTWFYGILLLFQASLGISTLLMYVPTPLAATHQSGSLVLLSFAIWLTHEFRRLPKWVNRTFWQWNKMYLYWPERVNQFWLTIVCLKL